MNLVAILKGFITHIRIYNIEIYNEAALQFELAIYLRKKIGPGYKIQLERNVRYFGYKKISAKKEIDIVIFKPNFTAKYAIELKVPHSQYPEQMYAAIKDIKFLEQLVKFGFKEGHLIFLTDKHLFYDGSKRDGIYKYFRNGSSIKGNIKKPTAKTGKRIKINGSYDIEWIEVNDPTKYFLISVKEPTVD